MKIVNRLLGFFFVIRRGRCGDPECKCVNHEVVDFSPWGYKIVAGFWGLFLIAQISWCLAHR